MSPIADKAAEDRAAARISRAGAGGADAAAIVRGYRRQRRHHVAVILGLLAVLLGLALVGLVVGASSHSATESWTAFLRGLTTADPDELGLAGQIVWQLRTPRVLLAVVAGMALALAGLVMQTILRNPLASPYTLGISSAASFGAALAIVVKTGVLGLGFAVSYDLVIVVNAFVFALVSTGAIYALTKLQRVTPETIVLLGVAMMFMFSALTSLVQYLGNPEEVAELAYWMFGSLSKATWDMLGVVTLVCSVAIMASYRWAWDLNAIATDDESAASSGVPVARLRLQAMVVASLVTATVVAFLGPIGFIGLVAPHLARILIGGDHRFLFPVSLTLGAIVLLLADIMARTVVAPVVIPVGIITAFVGVPLLIYLLLRRTSEFW